MSSTKQCKLFLAEYFTNTKTPLLQRWRSGEPVVWEGVTIANNWKRTHKVKAGAESAYMGPFDTYEIHDQNGNTVLRAASEFKFERCFVCMSSIFDSEIEFIEFLVLEDHHGNLFLGDDVSD